MFKLETNLKRKYYKYRYGKHPDKRTHPLEAFAYCSAFIMAIAFGYHDFFVREDVIWLSRKVFGIIWFLIGTIGLLIYGAVIWNEGKYLLIDDEKLIWKPNFFQKRNEILLETIERAEVKETEIILFIEDRTQLKIDKSKIISTKKKKELDRWCKAFKQ